MCSDFGVIAYTTLAPGLEKLSFIKRLKGLERSFATFSLFCWTFRQDYF